MIPTIMREPQRLAPRSGTSITRSKRPRRAGPRRRRADTAPGRCAGIGGSRGATGRLTRMARVLVSEKIADGGLDALRAAGHEVDVQLGLSPEELLGAIVGAHALIIRSATTVTAEVP